MKEEKPTREERLKAYEYIREWLNENMECTSGFCSLVKLFSANYSIDRFPELMEEKPTGFTEGVFWFSSAKERIQVLTKIINKMKEEPLIKPGQQFKIDSIEELKEAYEKLSPWKCNFDHEEMDFLGDENYRWVQYCSRTRRIYLLNREYEDYETIPNPFKKKCECLNGVILCPGCEGMSNGKGESVCAGCKGGNLIICGICNGKKEPIREELKALREEVEKLKGYRVFNGKEGLIEVNIPEEKPKESEELKLNHYSCELTLSKNVFSNIIELQLKTKKRSIFFCCDKDEAIKIVNYLKKHFEI